MKSFILTLYLVCSFYISNSQSTDTTQVPSFFRGQINATNNGVSLIPTFSLGRPAVLFDLNIGKGKLSFDPMLRFGMNGKPWAFVFWWRYKLVQSRKFNLGIGAHPAFIFRDVSIIENGDTRNFLYAQRFFAWEASPSYIINNKANIGVHYMGSKGLTKDVVQNTTFIALKSAIRLNLSNKLTLNLIPQTYYLKLDDKDGTYVNATLNLYKSKFPVSLNAIASKAIKTEITGKDFLWSIGLVYNINNNYRKLKK